MSFGGRISTLLTAACLASSLSWIFSFTRLKYLASVKLSISLCENVDPGKSIVEKLILKKVRFRDKEEETSNDMMIELSSDQPTSWRDMLVGHSSKGGFNGLEVIDILEGKEVIDILEGDIQRTIVNGVPSITFSDRIH
ncbi:hypothetical protein Godav_015825 [Gossypium davidsonii]|uniref:Uncharacterized protein n=1 Tax=Gossypium davidsonii TaxID=34287 RepID=A0A7J8RQ86_GOSDV|nr:hypothetical protein [Gossypium davidsonii]